MALETLKDVYSLGGFPVVIMDELREKFPEKFQESGQMDWVWFETEVRPKHFIYLRLDKNSISFTLQNGPVKENGVNGCQVDSLIHAAMQIIAKLNDKFPCRENDLAVSHLFKAIDALKARTADRETRGVEGTDQA